MYNGYKNFLVNGAVKMWVRVALNKEAMRIIDNNGSYSMSYIEGGEYEEYYFNEDIAKALEKDGFLVDMWNKFDAVFDWGDCDFFLKDKCILFKEWLQSRLDKDCIDEIKEVYKVMLDYANKAIEYDTGMSFDF